MLLKEEFSERVISNMDVALERACNLMPEVLASHGARKYVAEKIVGAQSRIRKPWAASPRLADGLWLNSQ